MPLGVHIYISGLYIYKPDEGHKKPKLVDCCYILLINQQFGVVLGVSAIFEYIYIYIYIYINIYIYIYIYI